MDKATELPHGDWKTRHEEIRQRDLVLGQFPAERILVAGFIAAHQERPCRNLDKTQHVIRGQAPFRATAEARVADRRKHVARLDPQSGWQGVPSTTLHNHLRVRSSFALSRAATFAVSTDSATAWPAMSAVNCATKPSTSPESAGISSSMRTHSA